MANPLESKLSQLLVEMISQLSLAELLKQLEIQYKGVLAYSLGKFVEAYFENTLSLEEVLECIIELGKLLNGIKGTKGVDSPKEAITKYSKINRRS